jgi:hypothetical protein
MKFCHLQVNGWNWRISCKVKLGSKGQKYVLPHMWIIDLKHAEILLEISHTPRGDYSWERKGNQKLEYS